MTDLIGKEPAKPETVLDKYRGPGCLFVAIWAITVAAAVAYFAIEGKITECSRRHCERGQPIFISAQRACLCVEKAAP